MKQEFMKFSLLAVVFTLFTACSKENNDENTEEPIKGITFSMSEAPYNADMEMAGSRASTDKVIKDTFTINGVEAEVTLERDHEQQPATRAITSGNHYTIVVFKAGTNTEVASIKGYFDAAGKFKYDAGSTPIQLSPANYDFVCYTHQYATRSGNTIEVPLQYADKAFVCKQLVTITHAKKQEIAFTMKHAGARVRTKLIAVMEPKNVVATLGYQANHVPASTVYDFTTGTFGASTNKNATGNMQAQNYSVQGTVEDATLQMSLLTETGNKYLTVLAGTKPEELVYNITGGTVYNATLNTNGDRKLKAGNAFEANGAYTLTIRLMPQYIYLFEDGQTGPLHAANRQGHIPIAIVFAPHKAIALWNAKGGQNTQWKKNAGWSDVQSNSVMIPNITDATNNTVSGQVWTWESYDSYHNGHPIVKAKDPNFEGFYYAGNFYQSTDLTSKLNGKTLSSNLNKDGVWYLPSFNEWREVLVKLGFGTVVPVLTFNTPLAWKSKMIHYAFRVAGGAPIVGEPSDPWVYYQCSTEKDSDRFYYIYTGYYNGMYFSESYKFYPHYITRPFVAY